MSAHESIDEMKHADRLAERILFLDGLPNFQMLGRLRIGENVEEILQGRPRARDRGARASSAAPSPIARRSATMSAASCSREILENEEEHIDFLETQFEMIERMGLQNYIQLQSEAGGGLRLPQGDGQ